MFRFPRVSERTIVSLVSYDSGYQSIPDPIPPASKLSIEQILFVPHNSDELHHCPQRLPTAFPQQPDLVYFFHPAHLLPSNYFVQSSQQLTHPKFHQDLTAQIHQLHHLLLERPRPLKLLAFQTQTLERKQHHLQALLRLEYIQSCAKETRLVGEVEFVKAGVLRGRFERVHGLGDEVEVGELGFEC